MKYSKRYVIFTMILLIVFLLKFHYLELDDAKIGSFRGGSLAEETWFPLVANDVNSKVIRLSIGNKEYTNVKQPFYMDNNRNIMVPVSILSDVLDCSAHIYEDSQLLVEKSSSVVLLTEGETVATGDFGSKDFKSPLVKIKGEHYVSLNELSEILGYNSSFDMNQNSLVSVDASENVASLPTAYDLRDRYRVSSIRNQGKFGTCWAFAANSAMESALLPEENYIFSVDHMSLSNSFNRTQYDGGEYTMGMAYLSAWQGPVYEKNDVYGDGKTDKSLTAVKHVQEMRILAPKDIMAIKNAVFKYGGVQSSFYCDLRSSKSRSPYYNSEEFAYCYIGTKKPNHDIVIIGWDDNYPKENFNVPLEGNGAFICQNSWGDGFGEDGIFYVSYYDSNIATHNVVYTRIDDITNYDNIYQSDLCGWVGKMGYDKEEIYGANVFTAKRNELISAASFYATAPDTEYEVFIVKDFEDESSFANRVTVAEGTLEDAGYYTIDFDSPVQVLQEERFAIVVYLYTPGATHPMAIEYDSGDRALDHIDLEDGEGYISYTGGKFINVKEKQNCNLCIKAFSVNK